jgi:hypothetical protein
MRKPSLHTEVGKILVDTGEVLTVWLRNGERTQQFELRVTYSGVFEVYTKDDSCVTSFDDWYPMLCGKGENDG